MCLLGKHIVFAIMRIVANITKYKEFQVKHNKHHLISLEFIWLIIVINSVYVFSI